MEQYISALIWQYINLFPRDKVRQTSHIVANWRFTYGSVSRSKSRRWHGLLICGQLAIELLWLRESSCHLYTEWRWACRARIRRRCTLVGPRNGLLSGSQLFGGDTSDTAGRCPSSSTARAALQFLPTAALLPIRPNPVSRLCSEKAIVKTDNDVN